MLDDLLAFVRNEPNIGEQFIRKVKSESRVFYCYGGGHYLQFAMAYLKRAGLRPAAILDSNHDGTFQDLQIIRYEDFLRSTPDQDSLFMITAPSCKEEIRKRLISDFKPENVFAFETELYLNFFPDIDLYRGYLTDHWTQLVKFRNELCDDISRHTFDCVVQGRISGDQVYFSQCFVPDQYYPKDLIHFSTHEVMVELGSNNGDTLVTFLSHCPQFQRVYCFEPDPNCIPLLEHIKDSRQEYSNKILIEQNGAWSRSTTLSFALDGNVTAGNGHIITGPLEVARLIEVVAVDNAVLEPITYMKMDTEGCELEALHGAERQILQNKPNLAICVYHKMDDFIEIWSYLKKLNPDYQFYLRHHNQFSGTETVLYAIAKH